MAEDGPRFGRRTGGKDEAKVDAPAPRRRAADGSDIAGGRKDAPSGWGESSAAPSIFSKKPVAAAHRSEADAAATKVDDELTDADGQPIAARNRGKVIDTGSSVTVIRDVDAVEPDDLETKVASAPRNIAGRKVQTLRELAEAGQLDMASSKLAGIDLSLLTAVLCAPDALEEADEPWEFDRMLQKVAQELTAEQERRDAEDAAASAT